jgi:hypothetical protein
VPAEHLRALGVRAHTALRSRKSYVAEKIWDQRSHGCRSNLTVSVAELHNSWHT